MENDQFIHHYLDFHNMIQYLIMPQVLNEEFQLREINHLKMLKKVIKSTE